MSLPMMLCTGRLQLQMLLRQLCELLPTDNKMHGSGDMLYSNGAIYRGSWVNGKKHGDGHYTYSNGNTFVSSGILFAGPASQSA